MIESIQQVEDIINSEEYMSIEFDGEHMLIRKPNKEDFKFTLFHGTSRYMIDQLSSGRKIEFSEYSKMDYKYALKILNYLKELANTNNVEMDDTLTVLISKIEDRENIDFSYEYMCLTTDIYTAKSYALNFKKVGELNACILYLYECISERKIPILKEYMEYIDHLIKAYDSEGIVIFVKDLDYTSICRNELEEEITFNQLLNSIINPSYKNNIHYHGECTDNIDIVPVEQCEIKYNEYRAKLKEKFEELRVYPLRNETFRTETFKNKLMLISEYRHLF